MIRERSTGSYRVGPYFLAKSTSDIGLYTAAPILYATAVYWSVGLRPGAGVFFKFLLLFMGQVRRKKKHMTKKDEGVRRRERHSGRGGPCRWRHPQTRSRAESEGGVLAFGGTPPWGRSRGPSGGTADCVWTVGGFCV